MNRFALLCLIGLATTRCFAAPPSLNVLRRDLLTAQIDPALLVSRVAIKSVTLSPGLAAGLHLHPVPVFGVVNDGVILFQLENDAPRTLHPGDAFYEPAGRRVLHFDNTGDQPATFTACYLLPTGHQDLIRMLAK
jgi:quercetin dioxygenase-like cupin family protein